jgi:hypothetical protein
MNQSDAVPADPNPPAPRSAPRPRARFAAAVSVLTVVAMVGAAVVGVGVLVAGSRDEPLPATTAGPGALAAAAQRTLRAGTARVSLTSRLSGLPTSLEHKTDGGGIVDFAARSSRLTVRSKGAGPAGSRRTTAQIVAGTRYTDLTGTRLPLPAGTRYVRHDGTGPVLALAAQGGPAPLLIDDPGELLRELAAGSAGLRVSRSTPVPGGTEYVLEPPLPTAGPGQRYRASGRVLVSTG